MVHTSSPNRVAGWTADALVGELIGRPGIDLSLVAPFASLAESSTDRLQLESIGGDVAVLDWQPAEQTIDALRELGLSGWRTPHPNDPEVPAPPPGQRRIYAIDLTRFSNTGEAIAALDGLRAHRQVQTFSLGSMGLPIAGKSDKQPPASPPAVTITPTPSPTRVDHPTNPAESQPVPETNRKTLDLDQLLDDLDQLDP